MTLLIILVVAYFINESIYAAKGQTSPRQYRANLRTEQGRYGWGDYFRDLADDAAVSATAHRRRVSAEKAAGERPTVAERAGRLGRLLWEPVGERRRRDVPAAAAEEPRVDPWSFSTPVADRQVDPLGLAGRDDSPPPQPESRRPDGQPETDADRRFFDLRESGYAGWIDQDGRAVDGPEFVHTDTPPAGDDQEDPDRQDDAPAEDQPADHPDSSGGTDMDENVTSSGEAVDVTTAHETCKQVALAVTALRERVSAQMAAGQGQVDQVAKAVESLDAAARGMEFDAATLDRMAALFETLNGLSAALRACVQAVAAGSDAAAGAVAAAQAEFGKHLPGVEFAASVGGMAKREAYNGG